MLVFETLKTQTILLQQYQDEGKRYMTFLGIKTHNLILFRYKYNCVTVCVSIFVHCSSQTGHREPMKICRLLLNVAKHLGNIQYAVWDKMKHIAPYSQFFECFVLLSAPTFCLSNSYVSSSSSDTGPKNSWQVSESVYWTEQCPDFSRTLTGA